MRSAWWATQRCRSRIKATSGGNVPVCLRWKDMYRKQVTFTPLTTSEHTHVLSVSETQSRLCNIWKYWKTHSQIISIINRNAYKTSKSRATSGDNVCVCERENSWTCAGASGRTSHASPLLRGRSCARRGDGPPWTHPSILVLRLLLRGLQDLRHTHTHTGRDIVRACLQCRGRVLL